MPTLEKNPETRSRPALQACPIEGGLLRLAASLSRAAAETAEAFFSSRATLATAWQAPRVPDAAAMHCSQKNIGEKYELLCNLTTDRAGYDGLFPAGVSDPIKLDAYCELANCICGAILADASFADEFGYLIPCVPCSGKGRLDAATRAVRGAFRVKEAWFTFSFAIQDAVPRLTAAQQYTAAA